MNSLSDVSLVAPYRFTGAAALSVLSAMTFCTVEPMLASARAAQGASNSHLRHQRTLVLSGLAPRLLLNHASYYSHRRPRAAACPCGRDWSLWPRFSGIQSQAVSRRSTLAAPVASRHTSRSHLVDHSWARRPHTVGWVVAGCHRRRDVVLPLILYSKT